MKNNIAVVLFFLLLFAGQSPAATDPQVADYLKRLNQYYYCLPREGLKSFKCDATATLSGDMLSAIAPKTQNYFQETFQYKFQLVYLGEGNDTALNIAMEKPDSKEEAKKIQALSFLADNFIKTWSIFSTNPLFYPEQPGMNYRISQEAGSGFTVSAGDSKFSQTITFDQQAVAQKVTFRIPKGAFSLKTRFDSTPQGFVLQSLEFVDLPGFNDIDLSVKAFYRAIQGFQLPVAFSFHGKHRDGREFQIDFQLSNYRVHGVVGGDENLVGIDTQIIPSRSEPPGAKHFLWRVQSNTAIVYLLGSIHIGRDEPLRLPEIAEQCFNASNYVGFEIDPAQLDKIAKESEAYFKENMFYPEGDSLKNHLTKAQWQELKALLGHLGIPSQKALRLKPVALMMMLGQMLHKSNDYVPNQGIDEIFMRKAKQTKKPTFGMEFWTDSMAVFDGFSDQEQINYLFLDRKASNQPKVGLDQITKCWQAGDTEFLEKVISSEMTPYEKTLNERMLKNRNAKWMLQMDRILNTQAVYFIVVGAGHLVGPYGLPNLLRLKGYPVDQF